MKKIKVKARAKINLTLDVLGIEGKYHNISTLVSTIDLHDIIIIKKRKDKRITLTMKGLPVDVATVDNNAYKACKKFIEKFGTLGVDIVVKKNIPVGGGLGGSSADIAGVLRGLKELFEINESVLPIANELGSDSGYLLSGGYAVLTGRGDKIEQKEIEKQLYLLIITENEQVSAKNSYKTFDKQGKTYKPCTDIALKALESGDNDKFVRTIKNDLYSASCEILPEIKANLTALKKAGADAFIMTGSGSAVYGLFFEEKQRNLAYKKLLPLYKGQLIKAKTEKII